MGVRLKKERTGMSGRLVSFTKDGLVACPTADSDEGGSIRIPQTSTSLGAGFGDPITPDDLAFAAMREPVAGFLIYGVASDVVEKWFKVNDARTEGADPEFDAGVQVALRKLKFRMVLRQLVEYERLFGKALLVGGFSDVQEQAKLMAERRRGAEPLQLVAYPSAQYNVAARDEDLSSPRYGQPLTYRINTQSGTSLIVHYSRCFEAQTRSNGQSILTLIWDDLTCGRNIRWGVSQWIFRTGGGFPVIKFPKEVGGVPTTKEKLQEWANAKEWSDISHRTYICLINELMDFKFEGAQGAALNPEPFFDTNTKQIAKATGIPKSILEGAEAGALTGSEKNDQQYYKKISGIQVAFEDVVRWVINLCLDAGLVKGVRTFTDQVRQPSGSVLKRMLRRVIVQDVQDAAEDFEYVIEWSSAFELNALDEARTTVLVEQANQTRLQYRTVDEVRKMNSLNPLPNGEGAKLKEATKQSTSGFYSPAEDQVVGEEKPQTHANASFTAMLKDYARKVMNGELTRDKAFSEGAVIIENYSRFEEQQAKIWVRSRTGEEGEIQLSPEMMGELEDQKKRFLKDYARILGDAEKLAKKRAG
ncbi:DUF1073 domain-containing protein [Candidatus Bathyarchaeota archaeon]|nr:DUF1073 domain-containing protein [Candidatus Bathyarchaeota archaeon]